MITLANGEVGWIPDLRGQGAGAEVRRKGHSMTSSARAIIAGGKVNPMAAAVLRLIAKTNRLACSIGMSSGLARPRIFCDLTGQSSPEHHQIRAISHHGAAFSVEAEATSAS
jgi:hypothetical protein